MLDGINFTMSTFSHKPRVGDTIRLLEGADIPYLIRERENGDIWEMIGTAPFKVLIDQACLRRFAGLSREAVTELEEFILD